MQNTTDLMLERSRVIYRSEESATEAIETSGLYIFVYSWRAKNIWDISASPTLFHIPVNELNEDWLTAWIVLVSRIWRVT